MIIEILVMRSMNMMLTINPGLLLVICNVYDPGMQLVLSKLRILWTTV